VFEVDETLHYCVANVPGGIPVTASRALTNATLPHVRLLATGGAALAEDPGSARGANVKNDGALTYEPDAEAFPQGPPVAAR
jgi:alanine dehydrogenase